MSADPPAGHRCGASRWERGTRWLQHVDPPPAVEGPWPPLASDPDAFTTFARDLGADERYRFIDVLDIDAPPKRALAFVVCYPTGGSVAEAILPLFSTDPPPNAAFFARQTVGGTCGTVALLNALLNAPGVALPELGIAGDRCERFGRFESFGKAGHRGRPARRKRSGLFGEAGHPGRAAPAPETGTLPPQIPG